jgi:hypothetical protein
VGPASVPETGDLYRARVEGIIIGRSEATTEPGRQDMRKNTADRRCICGTTVQKLRFDAECLDFLHSPIEHPRALAGFPKLRIGVPRSWTGPRQRESPADEDGAKRDVNRGVSHA